MYSCLYKKLTDVYIHKHTVIYLLIHRNIHMCGHISMDTCAYTDIYIYLHKHKGITWYLKNTRQFRKRGKEAIFPILFL